MPVKYEFVELVGESDTYQLNDLLLELNNKRRPLNEAEWNVVAGNSHLLLAKIDGICIGMGIVVVLVFASYITARIADLVVSSDHRGKDYGDALLQKLIAQARKSGATCIETDLDMESVAVRHLMRKHRFKIHRQPLYSLETY